MLDVRDTPVSNDSAPVLEGFEGALKSFQTFVGEPVAQLKPLLLAAPDFVLGHLFCAIAFYLSSEQRYLGPAQKSVRTAQAILADREADREADGLARHREQLLCAAVSQLVAGRWRDASRAFDEVLQHYPRDALALQTGHMLDFFSGDALNLRNRPGRVLPEWSSDTPGYSYVLGMYAFGLEECNQYAQAEEYARQALAIEPGDAWSIHAATHVMEMMGRSREGIQFLQERRADWSLDNGFSYHNWWHLCLLHLEHEEDEQVLDIYDQHIAADGDITLALVDATALLWRLHLLGVDYGQRSQVLAQLWSDKADESGYYAFNDFHAALSFCAAGDALALENLAAHLRQHAGSHNLANVEMSQKIGLPLVEGMQAYQAGRFAEAVQKLRAVKDIAHQFGGSHAQRDVINLTLLSAARLAGEDNLVRHLHNERLMLKPNGVLGARVLQAAS